jgi:hypothetical protein
MLSKGGKKHGGAFAGRVERPYSLVPVCFLPSVLSHIRTYAQAWHRCTGVILRALAGGREGRWWAGRWTGKGQSLDEDV